MTRMRTHFSLTVMVGLVPTIHAFAALPMHVVCAAKGVDAWHKAKQGGANIDDEASR